MTRIQVRRDTAANWSTNNPTPLAGEPCFETDTGKLKIGDGTTAYNDLAYQGGSDYELPVASASTLGGVKVGNNLQINSGVLNLNTTITGNKTFTGTNIFQNEHLTLGTYGYTGYGLFNVKTGQYESYIAIGRHPNYTNKAGLITTSGSSGTKSVGIYAKGYANSQTFSIEDYLSVDISPVNSKLTISADKLTFTKSNNTVVDLLAGSGGGGDVSAAGNNTFTGLNTFNEPIQLKTASNSVSIQQGSEQVGSIAEEVSYDCLTLQSSTGDIHLNPIGNLDLENSSGEMSSRQGRIVNGTNGEIIPSINDTDVSTEKTWSAKKLNTLTNAVQAADASAPTIENIYEFTVQASSAIYTAPFTGYIQGRCRFLINNEKYNDLELYLRDKDNNSSVLLSRQVGKNAGIFEAFIPIKKGQLFGYKYEGEINAANPLNTLMLIRSDGYKNEVEETQVNV